MRLSLVAVGRLKSGPERDLVERYRGRIEALGRSLGIPGSKSSNCRRAARAGRATAGRRRPRRSSRKGRRPRPSSPSTSAGRSPTSEAFAERLGAWRDEGRPAASPA